MLFVSFLPFSPAPNPLQASVSLESFCVISVTLASLSERNSSTPSREFVCWADAPGSDSAGNLAADVLRFARPTSPQFLSGESISNSLQF